MKQPLSLGDAYDIISRCAAINTYARNLGGVRVDAAVYNMPRAVFDRLPGYGEMLTTADERTFWVKTVQDVKVFCNEPPVGQPPEVHEVPSQQHAA